MNGDGELKMMSTDEFVALVESHVLEHGITHLEAIVKISEDTGIEMESLASMVGPMIKSKLEVDFMDINMLERREFLPEDW